MMLYLTMAAAGLAGSLHCVGMCGGFVAAYSLQEERPQALAPHLLFTAGRLTTYAFLGMLLGFLGKAVDVMGIQMGFKGLRPLAVGVTLCLLGAGLIAGLKFAGSDTTTAWLGRRLARGRARSPYTLGLAIGFLPCWLLFPAEVAAAGTGHPLAGALVMLSFGLGTAPILVGLGLASQQVARVRNWPVVRVAGGLVFALGCWFIVRGLLAQGWI